MKNNREEIAKNNTGISPRMLRYETLNYKGPLMSKTINIKRPKRRKTITDSITPKKKEKNHNDFKFPTKMLMTGKLTFEQHYITMQKSNKVRDNFTLKV